MSQYRDIIVIANHNLLHFNANNIALNTENLMYLFDI